MLATLLALLAAGPAPACGPVAVPATRFTPGEQLRYKLDVFGADVGTFDVALETPQGADRQRAPLPDAPADLQPVHAGQQHV